MVFIPSKTKLHFYPVFEFAFFSGVHVGLISAISGFPIFRIGFPLETVQSI